MPIAKIKMIVPDGEQRDTNRNCTYYKYIYTFPNPNGEGDDIRFGARHKIKGRFSVGDTVEYTPKGDPNWGTVQNPQQGNFQNSRPASQPAAPAANSSPPSSNGYADRDKSIRDAVIYKEACSFLRANPKAGMAKCVRTARALMEIVECADIPQDAPVEADSEIPF